MKTLRTGGRAPAFWGWASATVAAPARRMICRIGRICRQQWVDYVEHCERRRLRSMPWREDLRHFTPDGQVHGHLLVAGGTQRDSTTSTGWCPGLSQG